MNGLEALIRLGISEQHIIDPHHWLSMPAEVAFAQMLETPISKIVRNPLEAIDGQSGILKGKIVMEVLAYRDVTKATPPAKPLDVAGEEDNHQQGYSNNRTLKLLLSAGSTAAGTTFVAMEYESCPCLNDICLDTKIQISNCYYHHGVFLLTPDTVKLLGCPTKPFTEEPASREQVVDDAILIDD